MLISKTRMIVRGDEVDARREHLLGFPEMKVPLMFNKGLLECMNATSNGVSRDWR